MLDPSFMAFKEEEAGVGPAGQGRDKADEVDALREVREGSDEKAAAAWRLVRASVEGLLSTQAFATWFSDQAVAAIKLEGGKLHLCAANSVVKEWVTSNYARVLIDAVADAGAAVGVSEIEWSALADGNV